MNDKPITNMMKPETRVRITIAMLPTFKTIRGGYTNYFLNVVANGRTKGWMKSYNYPHMELSVIQRKPSKQNNN